jgi:hypothetical protein
MTVNNCTSSEFWCKIYAHLICIPAITTPITNLMKYTENLTS